MTREITVQELDPSQNAEWDAYVDRHPWSTCYHLRAWQDVARRAYHMDAPFLVARDAEGGPIRGALPLFAVRGMMQGHLTNGLFGAYGAILADEERVRAALLKKAETIFAREGLAYFLLKSMPEGMSDTIFGQGYERVDHWVIATLQLDPDPERMWRSFRDKIRNCVRKAQRFRLEPRWGPDQLGAFYDVLAENMHRKGSPIYGYEFMRELRDRMGDRAEIVTLWHEGRAISGAILLRHRGTASVPFASSRPSAFAMCPNNLLYWEMIRRCCLAGDRVFDFGRSERGTSTLQFKLGWGARIQDQPSVVLATPGKEPMFDPKDPLVDFFVRRWKSLPRAVADSLGPAVCRRWIA